MTYLNQGQGWGDGSGRLRRKMACWFNFVHREPNKALFEGDRSQSVRRVALTLPNGQIGHLHPAPVWAAGAKPRDGGVEKVTFLVEKVTFFGFVRREPNKALFQRGRGANRCSACPSLCPMVQIGHVHQSSPFVGSRSKKSRRTPRKSEFFWVLCAGSPTKPFFSGGRSQSVRRVSLTLPTGPDRPFAPSQPLCGQQEQKLATEASQK